MVFQVRILKQVDDERQMQHFGPIKSVKSQHSTGEKNRAFFMWGSFRMILYQVVKFVEMLFLGLDAQH